MILTKEKQTASDLNLEEHSIGKVIGKHNFPTIVVFAGIHGNEPAGVKALENILKIIEEKEIPLHGNLFAIKGNIEALKLGKRFIDKDLNRIWTRKNIRRLINTQDYAVEVQEQKKIHQIIKEIFRTSVGPYYFIDLHTTSSYTTPFITISDSLNNRKFSSKFNLPIILGIEEYLEGPLLTYLNEFGHVSLGFEAGQHDDESSISNCEYFLWNVLTATNCVDKRKVKSYQPLKKHFKYYRSTSFYHIKERYKIHTNEEFIMHSGFTNFQRISRGEELAISGAEVIKASRRGKIFMPLYQKQGDDGFFIIKKVSKFWLGFSKLLRKTQAHELLKFLPGIKKMSDHTLRIDPNTALFLTSQIFHLFGYRRRVRHGHHWYFTKRDRKVTSYANQSPIERLIGRD